jgi:hypothetical protein
LEINTQDDRYIEQSSGAKVSYFAFVCIRALRPSGEHSGIAIEVWGAVYAQGGDVCARGRPLYERRYRDEKNRASAAPPRPRIPPYACCMKIAVKTSVTGTRIDFNMLPIALLTPRLSQSLPRER